MKTHTVLAALALAVPSAFLVGQVAGLTLDPATVCRVVGGLAGCGLLLLAFSDYTRRPRFRTRSEARRETLAATPATVRGEDPALWTYTTHSA